MQLYLCDELAEVLPDPFTAVQRLDGELYRDREGRRTQRIALAGRDWFVKLHTGVGWREIAKNLLQLRAPVLGARNEWRALESLAAAGVAVPAIGGYGCRGVNPARQLSFLITEALDGVVSLEELCADWQDNPAGYRERKRLVEAVAELARRMHGRGINHRDFYLCHLLLDRAEFDAGRVRLYVIDLHRAGLRPRVPQRWLIKDLAGLYFSAADIGLGVRDVLRFVRHYTGQPPAAVLGERRWRRIRRRAERLYRREFHRAPRLPL